MIDVTEILSQIENGDSSSSDQLLPLVYDELRKLAMAKLTQEMPGQTLQATALVHEAYVRLVDVKKAQRWHSRAHFFAAAAEAMRRILIENARKKASVKHGGAFTRVEFDDKAERPELQSFDLLALDEALSQLEAEAPEIAEVVKLKFFTGLSLEETASALGRSRTSTQRDWTYARAWLFGQLRD